MLSSIKGSCSVMVECVGTYRTSRAALSELIAVVDQSLRDGSWSSANFSRADRALMPELVQMANEKKPGLNLMCLMPLEGLVDLMKNARDSGMNAYRVLINMGADNAHYAVLDCRVLEGRTSVFLLEPADFDCWPAVRLANEVHDILEKEKADVHLLKMEVDLQKSPSGCGMFCLALAKKLHQQTEHLTLIHQGFLGEDYGFGARFPRAESDVFLPDILFKHMQGRARQGEYFKMNPGAEDIMVNKKDQPLLERLNSSMEAVGGRVMSKSICNKRMYELNALMDKVVQAEDRKKSM